MHAGDLWASVRYGGAAAHTTNDSIVSIPDRSLLFCGDLIFNGDAVPADGLGGRRGGGAGADRAPLGAGYRAGDGPVFEGTGPLDATLDYLRFVLEVATRALAAGVTPLAAARDTDLGGAGWADPERIVGNLHGAAPNSPGPRAAGPSTCGPRWPTWSPITAARRSPAWRDPTGRGARSAPRITAPDYGPAPAPPAARHCGRPLLGGFVNNVTSRPCAITMGRRTIAPGGLMTAISGAMPADLAEAVRSLVCPACQAPRGVHCPCDGTHLARWNWPRPWRWCPSGTSGWPPRRPSPPRPGSRGACPWCPNCPAWYAPPVIRCGGRWDPAAQWMHLDPGHAVVPGSAPPRPLRGTVRVPGASLVTRSPGRGHRGHGARLLALRPQARPPGPEALNPAPPSYPADSTVDCP